MGVFKISLALRLMGCRRSVGGPRGEVKMLNDNDFLANYCEYNVLLKRYE